MNNPFEVLETRLEQLLAQQTETNRLPRELLAQRPTEAEEWMTLSETAKLLNLTESGLYQNKTVPRHKRNNRLYFKRSEVVSYIEQGKRTDQA